MNLAIIHIGLAQSLFAAILILQKRPLTIADKILAFLLFFLACSFALNLLEVHYDIVEKGIWPLSLSIGLTFTPLLYLYSKYTTIEYNRFDKKDLLHICIPLVVTWLALIIFKKTDANSFQSLVDYYNSQTTLRNFIGLFFNIIFWTYGWLALRNVNLYKKKLDDLYSYKSDLISLSWLRTLIVSFLILYGLTMFVSAFDDKHFFYYIEIFRKLTLLIFVYVLSIWGYKQIQLDSGLKPQKLNTEPDSIKTSNPDKYRKSGLTDDQANIYLQQLIDYMNQTEIWKDTELSVVKLSKLTNIPKHYITQALNNNLQKNFYTFINEYRIEYAMKLIKSPKYASWSFAAIAFEVGFNSRTAFNIFFKKHTGKTPSEFKKEE